MTQPHPALIALCERFGHAAPLTEVRYKGGRVAPKSWNALLEVLGFPVESAADEADNEAVRAMAREIIAAGQAPEGATV